MYAAFGFYRPDKSGYNCKIFDKLEDAEQHARSNAEVDKPFFVARIIQKNIAEITRRVEGIL